MPTFPVTVIPFAMYMVNYCHVQGNTSRSLSGMQSSLKTYSTQNGHAWLSPDHKRIIREVRKGLANHDHSVPLRKLPITSAIITKLRLHTMDLSHADDHQLYVMCLVAHNGLLRGSELCKLNRKDVHRMATGFALHIHKSKANKGGPREVVVYPNFAGSAASVLDSHLAQTQHLKQKPLFINLQTRKRMTKAEFSTALRAKLHRAGYPAGSYSAHSFRAGGATDLFHNNCPPLYIKMHGRSKSDTFHIYIRDNPDARAAQLAHAFAAC
jgi:integrase